MEERKSDSRKKRRIAPLTFTTAPPVESLEAKLVAPNQMLNLEPPAEPGAWDFLTKWEATDNTIISGIEEDEYCSDVSGGSSDAIEIAEQESEEGDDITHEAPAARPSRLGTDKVIQIINDCIKMYTEAWTPGKGEMKHKDETGQAEVPVTYDALALWEDAEAAGQREQLAERYELEAEYYRQRLDKLCEEISKDPGDTISGVQMKCRNLEVTVELLERASWLEGLYKLPPDISSDDESHDKTPYSADKTQGPGAQSAASAEHGIPRAQIFDLGTPSDSEVSEDESTFPGEIPTTLAQANSYNQIGQIVSVGLLASDAVIVSTIETAGPAAASNPHPTVRSRAPLSDAPEDASFSAVRRWNWAQLEETQDRKRIVSKAICELESTDLDLIRKRFQVVGRANMVREISACIDMILHGDMRMPGILPQDLPKILIFAKLFLCWWLCGNYFQKDPSVTDLAEMRDCQRNRSLDPITFCDYVGTILSTTFSQAALKRPAQPSAQPSHAEIIVISSDDEEPSSQLLFRRKSNLGKAGRLGTTITIE
ncbi:hypothetical protein SVAN01_05853 [Stagonosporopsis vannaccii]|nr:hypothetical protein SVAN01_05853 [Stagonosporopsis vannaccii]